MRLREELGCDLAVALGGSPLDADFLSLSEIPIIVPGPDGQPDPELLAKVPNARIAPAPGSTGWVAAVDEAWTSVLARNGATAGDCALAR